MQAVVVKLLSYLKYSTVTVWDYLLTFQKHGHCFSVRKPLSHLFEQTMMKVCLEDSYSTAEAPEISNLVFPVQTLAHEMASFCSV